MDYRENLHKRICDCEENATNTQTYYEFLIHGWDFLGYPFSKEQLLWLEHEATSAEICELVEELDWIWK